MIRTVAGLTALTFAALAVPPVTAADEETGFTPFTGYAAASEFSVVPRQGELVFFPCSQCHEFMEPDATIRELMSPHEVEFKHGQGRFWCYACHKLDNREQLVAVNGEPVSFDDSHLVCGGCHGLRHKDWAFGAHGKRQTSWTEDRVIYNCTHCHDAHDPVIKPREPMAGPGVRTGLERVAPERHEKPKVWQRRDSQEQKHEQ